MTKTRFKQRFENFEKAYHLLEKTVKKTSLSELERGGMIQFFEISFELAWKMLKDYLESEGYTVDSPRDALKQGFQINLIENGHVWMQALEDRNLTTHTYDEKTSLKVEKMIRETYFPAVKQLYDTLKQKTTA